MPFTLSYFRQLLLDFEDAKLFETLNMNIFIKKTIK